MEFDIGKKEHAKKLVIYGSEGIGKSTFASNFPDPVFIDTEGSTKNLDVFRMKRPSSWTMLLEQVKYLKNEMLNSHDKTIVLDTADWAEILCMNHICASHNIDGIEGFGYGKGYTYLAEEFGRLLNMLEEFIGNGINVVITAHALMRKIELPNETGAYDHWELKLQKKTASLIKEWADLLLFANYKILVVEDSKTKTNKAKGGKRVMYTSHHPCWDAKNRYDLPDELPLDFESIAHLFKNKYEPPQIEEGAPADEKEETTEPEKSGAEPAPPLANADKKIVEQKEPKPISEHAKALYDLMKMYNVSKQQVQEAVAHKGYFPIDTPIENYPVEFVKGVLVSAWPQVFKLINELSSEIPL